MKILILLLTLSGASISSSSWAKSLTESFLLYTHSTEPFSSCEEGAKMTLRELRPGQFYASLRNVAIGSCQENVSADGRVYNILEFHEDSCGSLIYNGRRIDRPHSSDSIEILDHRRRKCQDSILAEMIVKEKRMFSIQTLYYFSQEN